MVLGKSLYELEIGGKNVVQLYFFRKQCWEALNNKVEFEPPTFAAGMESKLERTFLQLRELLCFVRPSQSSLDRDKVYSVLGIASKFLDCKPDPFTINRGTSTEDVYTWITSLILENSLTLGILSDVEDRAHRKTTELPSWVPDLALRPGHFAFDRLSVYDATGVRDGHVADLKIDDKQLTLAGVEFSSISSVFKWRNNDEAGKAAFRLALEMAAIYSPTGECRLEAVWRTLLADHDSWDARDYHPSSDCCAGFCDFVKESLLRIRNAAPFAESDNAISAFEKMEEERIAALCEKKDLPLVTKEKTAEGEGDQCASSESASQSEQDYDGLNFFMHAMFVRDRCLFRTSNGCIGMALDSIKTSDTVWLLKGGRVPYVLRKLPGDGRYSFFGDCYVHGVMRGELMTEELRSSFASVHII